MCVLFSFQWHIGRKGGFLWQRIKFSDGLGGDHKEKITTFIICGTIFIAALSIIAVISGTIMRVFGFQYESVGSIALFFIIATAMSFPLNLMAGGLPKALYELERISKKSALILYILLDTIATSVGLKIVDYYMQSVSATTTSIIVISFLLALSGKDDFKDKQEEQWLSVCLAEK